MRNGMVLERKCTDVLTWHIFFFVVATMFLLAYYGFYNGNVRYVIGPVDADHFICGADKGYEEYDRLYLTDLGRPNITSIF